MKATPHTRGWRNSAFEAGTSRLQQPFQSIDLMGMYSVLERNLRLILAITVTFIILGYVYLQSLPPEYSAHASVILDTREEQITPAQEVISNLNVTSAVLAGEIITIRSNVLIGRVVDRLDLTNNPEFDPRVPRWPGLWPFFKRFLTGREPSHEVAKRLPDSVLRSWVVDALRQRIAVEQVGVSYVIAIRVDSENPELAAEIANAVTEEYIDSLLDTKAVATQRVNAWLAERLNELSVQVEEADDAVVDFKAKMIDDAGGSEETINQLLAELNTRLVASTTDRADSEIRLQQVESLLADGGLDAVGDVLTSPLLETLQQELAVITANRAQLESSLGPRHPDMVRISAQISDINNSIDGELSRRVEELRSNVRVTGNREIALRDQILVVSEQADKLSKDSVRLGQLERTAEATRLVYENFLTRFKETRAQADFQTPEARVIATAVTPVVPSGPKKTLFLLSTMIMGLAAAIGFVFLRNLVRSPVSTPSELRELTNLPNLAVLPFVGSAFKDKNAWLKTELAAEQGSPYLERVKAIRTELFNVGQGQQPKVIMITSSVPDEGKTSLSCTLAKVLIQPKKSVLIIDADLRRPDIRQALDMPKHGGCLVDFLEGKIKQQNLIQRSESLGLDVIAPCRSADNASDLLASPVLLGLITRVSQKYDMIVINATPVLHLSDTLLLAGMSDATLLAVKCDSTSSKVVTESLHRLQKAKDANVVGTVLTMVRRSHSKSTELDMFNYEY